MELSEDAKVSNGDFLKMSLRDENACSIIGLVKILKYCNVEVKIRTVKNVEPSNGERVTYCYRLKMETDDGERQIANNQKFYS